MLRAMKNYLLILALFVSLGLVGCAESEPQESVAAEAVEAVELTDEEAAILEVTEAAEEAAPVTQENYEEALKALEEEVDAEQQ